MGGGKSQTSTQTVSIPPEVLARYNAVNARAEETAKQPFQQYGGEFVAPLTQTQQAGIQATSDYSQAAQPYYGAATGLTMAGARGVGPLTRGQIGYYQDPAMLATLAPTTAALQQQQGQQLAQQQSEAIRAGAFGGERAGLQRAQLLGQQQLGMGQALAPIYQQAYQTGLATAQQQQGVLAQDQARRLQAGQQLAGLGTGAQQAALQGAQAQIGAGTLQQQTQQAQDTAKYQQFLQERGYPFQVAQFLANIAEGTGALSGSTTTTTQPSSFFSDRRLKHDAQKIGETKDGLPIYSFKYNGDDRTQIGLMAQDVEKKHPEAVGLAGGYKTVDYEKALRPAKKADGGGLDPNSMGGVVSEPGLFARGGYATSGAVIDPTDLSAILQQQRQSFGPWSAAGPYGQAPGAAPHGASGIVPQQQMHVPKLITAGAAPKPTDSGFSNLYKGYQDLNQVANDMTGKGLTRRAGESLGLVPDAAKQKELETGNMGGTSQYAVASDRNASASEAPAPPVPLGGSSLARPADLDASSGGGLWDSVRSFLPFEHGGVVPRHHYADGGSHASVNPYENRDPSEGYIEDTIQEEDEGKNPDMLKPAGGSGGSGSGSKLGLGKLAGSAIGSAFGPLGSVAGGFLGGLLPFNEGGVVPRQHFLGGGDAEQPAIDADASFNRAVGNLLKREGGLGIDNNGARVNFGMNQASHPDIDVRELTPETAAQRYRTHYWNAIGGDKLPPDLANVALDTAAMAGPGKANQLLKASGGDPLEMLHQRHQFLANLVSSGNPQYGPQVAKAWQSRYENMVNELGGKPQSNLLAYLPQGQGLGQTAGQQAIQRATSGQDQGLGRAEKPGFVESNKQYILPILQGLGAMAGSKSRYLGSAILEGLGAGAKAYGDIEAQQAGIEQTRTGTGLTREQISAAQQTQSQKDVFSLPNGQQVVLMPDGTTIPYGEWVKRGRPPTYSQARAYGAQPKIGAKGPTGAGISVSEEAAPYAAKIGQSATDLANTNASFVQNNGVKTLALDPKTNNPFADAADRSNIAATGMPQTLTFAKALSSTPAGGPITSSIIDPFMMKLVDLGSRAGLDLSGLKADMSAAEVVQKLNTQLANATRKGAAYEELQRISQSIPSTWNSKEGQAQLVASMLSNERTALDEHNYYNNYRRYLESQHGLTADESLFSGRGLKEQFLRDTALQREQEKKAMAGMFNDYILDKTGKPALLSKDAEGNMRPTTVLNYLIENAGSGDPRIMKALAAKYGEQVVKNMPRYFGGQ